MTSQPTALRLTRRGRRVLGTAAIAILILIAYASVIGLSAAPAPAVVLAGDAEQTVTASAKGARALVKEEAEPSAIGWAGEGASDEVFSNSDEPAQLASMSKLITALVCQEAQPTEPGEDGPAHTWTAADVGMQREIQAKDGIAFPIPEGTEVSTRQMLELALLPSANDFATAYANEVFGSNAKFTAAVDAWAEKHDVPSVHLAEPSGLSEENVASPADMVKVARLALANPTITEITGMKKATLPWGIGEVENSNPMLGAKGVVGLKTGTTSTAGYNLTAAREVSSKGRELIQITVVFGRGSGADRYADTRTLLTGMTKLLKTREVVGDGEVVGTATTVEGKRTKLVAASGAAASLLPEETATRITAVALGNGEKSFAAGATVGSIRVAEPTGGKRVDLIARSALSAPGYWWKFTHPLDLLGG